eukprot:gene18945-22637_t
MLDFAGPYNVNDTGPIFGHPTMYLKIDPYEVAALRGEANVPAEVHWDGAVKRSTVVYNGLMYHWGNNCYQYVSHCLNTMEYK